MLTIHDINIGLDDIRNMTIIESGKTVKEALINYYSKCSPFCNFISSHIDESYQFKILVSSKEELLYFFNFFESLSLEGNQTILIRNYEMSYEDLLDAIDLYNDDEFINRLFFKTDDSEFVHSSIFKEFVLKLIETKKQIPTDCSQLEIITHIYDIVKKREYKNYELDEKSMIPRNLCSSFLTEYIVCVGFAKIFNMLLREYNIPCVEYKFQRKDELGHYISLVSVDDDKYDIHGLYFFDPTGDSFVNGQNNEVKYKYFLQSFEDFDYSNMLQDDFDLLLSKDNDVLEKIASSMEESAKRHEENIFENKKFDKTLSQIFYLLEIDHQLFETCYAKLYASFNAIEEKAGTYQFISYIKSKFGKRVEPDKFIDLMVNTHDYNYSFLINSLLSKFDYINEEENSKIMKLKRND